MIASVMNPVGLVASVDAGGLTDLFDHPFLRNAFVGGTGIALACGLVGYFVVLRSQVFTGDALSHVAFTGALAALAFGIDARLGLFVATVGAALILGVLGVRGRSGDVVIGAVFAWVLGLGVLFLSIYTTSRSTGGGNAGISVLFGSIFGLDTDQAVTALLIGGGVSVALLVLARRLLFASVDPAVAAARGVPVGLVSYGFLVLVGFTAGEATQAVGALLLLGLIAAPAGIARQVTVRPYRGLAVSAAVAVGAMWIGLTVSYVIPSWPPSFSIIAVVTAAYAGVLVVTRVRQPMGDADLEQEPEPAPA